MELRDRMLWNLWPMIIGFGLGDPSGVLSVERFPFEARVSRRADRLCTRWNFGEQGLSLSTLASSSSLNRFASSCSFAYFSSILDMLCLSVEVGTLVEGESNGTR
jgi:hypothetical protein